MADRRARRGRARIARGRSRARASCRTQRPRDPLYWPARSPQDLSVGCSKQMRLARLWAQIDAITNLRPQRRIDPRDGGAAGEIEMDQRVRAERLDQPDVDRDAISGIRSHSKMFGANAQH